VIRSIPPNQRITIVEPRAVPWAAELAPGETAREKRSLELVSVFPHPIGGLASIELRAPVPTAARLSVFDVRGRRVRTWNESALPAGVSSVSWNRADENGSRLPAGVYMIRLESGGEATSRKVVLVD
jgi:hypothetical protein